MADLAPAQIVDLARQLRDLGAVRFTCGPVSVEFSRPARATVAAPATDPDVASAQAQAKVKQDKRAKAQKDLELELASAVAG